MTTNASIGHGTMFAIMNNDASPPGYQTLAEVVTITPPALARDAVEATHTESTEKWREFIPGLKDGGEVSVELNFIPGNSTTALVFASFNSDEALQCRITFPDGSPATVWLFNAICTGFAPEAPIDDRMSATVTLKLTGKPTFVGS